MTILSIDTSCDDTSAAVTKENIILSNVISSQVRYHKKFGGVVPFLAQRLHKERIDAVIELALQRANCNYSDINAVAVTYGPGLAPALQVGIEKAKELAVEHNLPLYAVNHMAGHTASCYAQVGSKKVAEIEYPALALLVSGNHTELVLINKFGNFEVLGEKLDDALGEAYDKVARMWGLGYPGGKLVAKLAKAGNDQAFELPIPLQYTKDLNFSFSGLKNAARLLTLKLQNGHHEKPLSREQIQDLAAVFERVAQTSVILKLEKALEQHSEVKSVLIGGGVATNAALRTRVRKLTRKIGVTFHVPANLSLCTDNAAMIGVAAYLGIQNGLKPVVIEELDRVPGLSLSESLL